jgi:UDP-glucose 4-epimerase
VFNIGPQDDGVTVRTIAELVRDRVSPGARISFGTGNRGWIGDVPRFRYSIQRLATTGWAPKLSSLEAVSRAIDQIASEEL